MKLLFKPTSGAWSLMFGSNFGESRGVQGVRSNPPPFPPFLIIQWDFLKGHMLSNIFRFSNIDISTFVIDNLLKSYPKDIKHFSCSTQLNIEFILLINVWVPTLVCILTFISMINTSERLKARNIFICLYFSFYEQLKFSAQLSWAWKKFYNLDACILFIFRWIPGIYGVVRWPTLPRNISYGTGLERYVYYLILPRYSGRGQWLSWSSVRLKIKGLLVQVSPLTESLVVCLSKTIYVLLSTGSTQEDRPQHDWILLPGM